MDVGKNPVCCFSKFIPYICGNFDFMNMAHLKIFDNKRESFLKLGYIEARDLTP